MCLHGLLDRTWSLIFVLLSARIVVGDSDATPYLRVNKLRVGFWADSVWCAIHRTGVFHFCTHLVGGKHVCKASLAGCARYLWCRAAGSSMSVVLLRPLLNVSRILCSWPWIPLPLWILYRVLAGKLAHTFFSSPL
uniref:Putative secreted protein n=1 Tax=Amblyomma triste TaxID=251400 RepID=A0A023G4Q0_AMBTT